MKFKGSAIAYWGMIFMHLLILALWIVLIIICPIQNWEDFSTSVILLLVLELILFIGSPIAHRTVTIDEKYVTEKWLCFAFNQMEISKISDVGVCTYLSGNQVRQFVFISTDTMSNEEIVHFDSMGILQRKKHKGRFISIDHPQKGLDECMKRMAEKNSLHYRQISV